MKANFLRPHIRTIHRLCELHGVSELYAFGSVLRGDFSDASDVDFLIEMDWTDEHGLSDRFFGLKADLEGLLGRKVDLVCLGAIRNPFFRRNVDANKELIYAA